MNDNEKENVQRVLMTIVIFKDRELKRILHNCYPGRFFGQEILFVIRERVSLVN